MRNDRTFQTSDIPLNRYRKREGIVVKTIVSDAKVFTQLRSIMSLSLLIGSGRLF